MRQYGKIDTKPAEKPFDRDRLHMVDRMAAVDAAQLALSAVEHLDPAEMVAGVAILYEAIMSRTRCDAFATNVMAKRLMRHSAEHYRTNASVQSLLDFAGLRIAGDANVSIS